jgi:hypothetical protein
LPRPPGPLSVSRRTSDLQKLPIAAFAGSPKQSGQVPRQRVVERGWRHRCRTRNRRFHRIVDRRVARGARESLTCRSLKAEGLSEAGQRIQSRGTTQPTFQVRNSTRAQTCPFGEPLLRQPNCRSVLTQQDPELHSPAQRWHALSRAAAVTDRRACRLPLVTLPCARRRQWRRAADPDKILPGRQQAT